MGIVLALLLALVGGIFVLTNDDGEKNADKKKDSGEQAAGEVFLEPIAEVGPAPFTDDVDINEARAPIAPAVPTTVGRTTTSGGGSTTTGPATAVRGVSGTVPGLYGGSGSMSSCDVPRLIEFLEQNADKARAWAEVLGIEPAGIRDYVMTLTPVVLRADTRVTNHGYSNGRATTLQSILQAGTAVLVDSYGVPRVKCKCGNPLTPPEPVSGPPTYTGTQWPTFSPTTVIVVQPAPTPAPTIILINLNHGEPIERPPGVNSSGAPNDTPVLIDTYCQLYPRRCVPDAIAPPATTTTTRPGEEQLGTGELQATLRWYSTADLDLSVTDPGGETISYGSPTSSRGGTLDVDANSGCSNMTSVPAENIFWPSGSARVGKYQITVTYYESCAGGEGPQPFDVTVLAEGGEVAVVPAAATERTAAGAQTPTAAPVTRTYTFRVQGQANRLLARNTGTLNAPGDTQTFLARKEGPPRLDAPPGAPTNVRATAGTNGATVTWKPPASSGGGSVQRYIVTIQPGGTEIVAYAPTTTIDIPGLRAGTPYTFTVTAENVKGKGPASQPSNSITPRAGTGGTTPPTTSSGGGTTGGTTPGTGSATTGAQGGAPGAPTGLSLDPWSWNGHVAGAGGHLNGGLSWNLPRDFGKSPISGWVIEFEQTPSGGQSSRIPIEGPDASFTFDHLDFWGARPPASWRIRVSAVNAQGEGPPSEWLDFSIGCEVYGEGIGPQNMMRTLCEHDPLSAVADPDLQPSDP